ncbi:hypothetical protein JQ625_09430 [Bradyrhizobium diazoefficiens]|nr:hypothetical protein [Bradyrhizobium diazoefficiens]MBR0775054.1 hypothetical protein [Bradyrhizobium diazoefficiens]
MPTDISRNYNADARPSSKPRFSSFSVVFALAVSACAVYAAANGPALWSNAQQLKTERIQQEDRMFCERFRMPPGSESFPMCVASLAEVRSLHGDRVAAAAAGVP